MRLLKVDTYELKLGGSEHQTEVSNAFGRSIGSGVYGCMGVVSSHSQGGSRKKKGEGTNGRKMLKEGI